MKKNKKLLVGFFAINTIINAGTEGRSNITKGSNLYEKMIKNIETGRSNADNYKLIEKILKKRNAELKDLYLQNDYVVKPEYIEWQWFGTGFYAESIHGDNTSDNGKSRSETEGYYNEKGVYVVTEGKPFLPPQEVKTINLGMSIPVKGVSLNSISINPGGITLPNIEDVTVNVTIPAVPAVASVSIPSFTPTAPHINTPPALNDVSTGFHQGAELGFNINNEVVGNGNIVSGGVTTIGIADTATSVSGNSFTYGSWNDMYNASGTVASGTYNTSSGLSHQAVLNALAGSYDVSGNWILKNLTVSPSSMGLGKSNTVRFISVNHAYGDYDKNTVFTLTGNVNIFGRENQTDKIPSGPHIGKAHMTVGIEHQSYGGLPAKAINKGIMTLERDNAKGTVDGLGNVISGTNLIDMTGMIENTNDGANSAPTTNTTLRNENVWESTMENQGKIIINSRESIGIDFAEYYYSTPTRPEYYGKFSQNLYTVPGNITVNGDSNYGLRVANIYKNQDIRGLYYDETVIDGGKGVIEIKGNQNVGVSIAKIISGSDKVLKYQKSGGADLDNTGRPNYGTDPSNPGTSPVYGDDLIGNIYNLQILVDGSENIGFLRKSDYMDGSYDEATSYRSTNDFILTDSHIKNINFTGTAQNGVLIRTDKYGIELRKNLDVNGIADSVYDPIPTASKPSNVVLLANETQTGEILNPTIVKNSAVINLGYGTTVDKQNGLVGLMANNEGKLQNNAAAVINVNSKNSVGIAVMPIVNMGAMESTGVNLGNINVAGEASTGVYNAGKFTMTSGTIDVTGEKAVAVYGAENNIHTNLNGGSIKVTNNGIGLLAGDNATINVEKMSMEIGSNGLLTYTYKDEATRTSTGHINIKSTGTGIVNADINAGGTAFYLKDDLNQITNFINNVFTGAGKLNLNMTSPDSRLFILDSPTNDINLSSSTSTAIENLIPSSKVSITGTGYKPYAVFKGTLIVDQNVDLDDTNDAYNRLDFLSSKTTVNSGIVLSGTKNNKSAIGQTNYKGTNGRNEITVINNGTINQTGQNVIGIITDFGNIENNGIISQTGDSSIGLYGANGTVSKNEGSIVMGNNGIGIYGVNLITTLAPGFGDQKIEIINNKEIKSAGTTGGIGIYADNTTAAVTDSTIQLGSASDIDMTSSANGVGVYGKNTSVTGGGNISVNSGGIGMYLENSKAVLNNITMNLSGNTAVGFNIAGTADISGTGTFNANGTNSVLFNLEKTVPSTDFINFSGFTVNGTGNYIGGNILNAGFYHNNAQAVNEKSTMAIGKNSVILFDSGTNISVTGNNNVIATADGAYNGGMPFVFNGTTADKELTNLGNISVGDKSAVLYAKNNAAILNSGIISTGKNSAGLYGVNITDAENKGTINAGESSTGIYLKESTTGGVINSGKILSMSDFVTGIASEYNGGGTAVIKTTDEIKLTGNNSIGIYTTGSGIQTIENTGHIEVGNSADLTNPSIAIYNVNDKNSITNTGTIKTGEKSLGIYNNKGTVTERGTLDIGNSGVGIYSDGGNVTIDNTGAVKIGTNEAVGIYAKNNAVVQNNLTGITIGKGSYGFIAESGSDITNTALQTLNDNSVFVYGDKAGTVTNTLGADINVTGSDNIIFYTTNGGTVVNDAKITASTGNSNIGIYNTGGSIINTGEISVGDSVMAYDLQGNVDASSSKYAVGIYGELSKVENHGDINIGSNAVGIYIKDNGMTAVNRGNIRAGSSVDPKAGAVGIFAEGGVGIDNYGNIDLYGKDVVGIAGKNSQTVTNRGVITVEGQNAVGIYGTLNTTVDNRGTINVSGTDSTGIIAPGGKILNNGIINFTNGAKMTAADNEYEIPELINAGIIKVNGNFENTGMDISLKPDLSTLQESTISGIDFIMNSGSISADKLTITDTVKILPDFSQGTNAEVYKLENAFISSNIISSNGKLPVISKSLTWRATPSVNSDGNIDIYMEKIKYKVFTDDLWYEDFGNALDENYYGATGDAGKIYDRLDLIENEKDFRHVMESLAGNIYANINQREEDIARSFENSMDFMQNSPDNTKENVKVNIIAGKGRTKEDTDGITDYDYTTTGVLALREVERTYRHTFGYSLGYLHTGFEFSDGNSSEEQADTVQMGVHNKYTSNGWNLRNDLTGRVSFHDTDRNIDWPSPTGRSEMSGTYETYSVTSDNILGKELGLGKNTKITPYGALRAMYVTRPDFTEKGLESLEVEGNDAWSVKPRAGVELKTAFPIFKSGWELKGALDIAYEYELADLNEREYARLSMVEENYHKLAKPEDEKGTFRTRASLGVEAADRYGIFLTGEYKIGNDNQEDYRAGVVLKAIF